MYSSKDTSGNSFSCTASVRNSASILYTHTGGRGTQNCASSDFIVCTGLYSISVHMNNSLMHQTFCPALKGSVSDILLHFSDIFDVTSLNFRFFHRTLCPTF